MRSGGQAVVRCSNTRRVAVRLNSVRLFTLLAPLLAAMTLAGPVAGAPIRLDTDISPGVRFFYRGQELHEIAVTVDTIAGSLFINGMSVLDFQSSLTEDECQARWGGVRFISERMTGGRSCLEALDDYDNAIDVCFSKIRAVTSDVTRKSSVDSQVLVRALWESVDELPEAAVIAGISVAHGVPSVLIDGAPRPVRLLSATASSDSLAAGTRSTPGARLMAYAESLVNMLASPYSAPALVAVAKGGGLMRVVGEERVADSLRQIEHYQSKGIVCKGPLTEAFFR